ncbi:hypothetical protein M0812_07164 [Anaeramoeba flamelloides]|uniref:Uncharacterized protein n=1 Tax=Anaeramoeba flamelloides TaxID=1746091 RepID=A0AAV8A9K3_9EUKA|nr:hypothetical protein M0812_07164 [Anaeramoeba flamelloides]
MGKNNSKEIVKHDLKTIRSLVPKKYSPNHYKTKNYLLNDLTNPKVNIAIEEETTLFHEAIKCCGEKVLTYLLLVGADPSLNITRISSKKFVGQIVNNYFGYSNQTNNLLNSQKEKAQDIDTKPVMEILSSLEFAEEAKNKDAIRVIRLFEMSPKNFKEQFADRYQIPQQYLKIAFSGNRKNTKTNSTTNRKTNQKMNCKEYILVNKSEIQNEEESQKDQTNVIPIENMSDHQTKIEQNSSNSCFHSDPVIINSTTQKNSKVRSETSSTSSKSKNSTTQPKYSITLNKSPRGSEASLSLVGSTNKKNTFELPKSNFQKNDDFDSDNSNGMFSLNFSSLFETNESMLPQLCIQENNIQDVYDLIQVIKRIYQYKKELKNDQKNTYQEKNDFSDHKTISKRKKQFRIDPKIISGLHKLRIMDKQFTNMQKRTETEMEKDLEFKIQKDRLNLLQQMKKRILEINERIQKDSEVNVFFKKIQLILADILCVSFISDISYSNDIYINFFHKHHQKVCKVGNSQKKISKLTIDFGELMGFQNEEQSKSLISQIKKQNRKLKKLKREEKEYRLIVESLSLLIDCNSKIQNKLQKMKHIQFEIDKFDSQLSKMTNIQEKKNPDVFDNVSLSDDDD